MPSGSLKYVVVDENINPLYIILAFGGGALLASMLLKEHEKSKNVEGMQNSCQLRSPQKVFTFYP